MEWSLYNQNGFLKPYLFSNNKSQEDVVKEVIESIKEGHKIIFIKGACGSGKSAIALNIAKELGKTSIIVPLKPLQKQYQDDYTNKLYILKNNKKLNISIIDGRNNHVCPFNGDCNCDNKTLPCTIDIKKENLDLLKGYINLNPFVKLEDFNDIKEIRRKSIAPACPYWSPIIPNDINYYMKDADPIEYKGLKNKNFTIYRRKNGCNYYDQFTSYINSDVIIFNSKKYELENVMDRKPATEVEIIDECDEFLDNLSSEKRINLDKLSRKLMNVHNQKIMDLTIEINDLLIEIIKNNSGKEPLLIKNTKLLKLLKYFLNNPVLIEETEEEISNYLYTVYEIAKSFEDLFNETYISFNKNEYQDMIVSLVTINLEKKLKEFLDKNNVFVMMSGTIHSEGVLKEIFGIKKFKIIEAETRFKGKLKKISSGLERDFKFEFYKQNRELYLKALSKCIELAKKPVLVHVKAFSDLPTEFEHYTFKNIKTELELKKEQETYKRGELLNQFKNKEIDILYSTKCSRGVDLPKELCNSIIFTRYPYPNIDSLFWKVLKKSRPEHFRLFYFDKARRSILQGIYRGLRSEDDEINLLSPDLRVLNNFQN